MGVGRMKKILRGLSMTIACLGFLGSFVVANYGGMIETRYGYIDRDYGLTFGIFVGCCLSVALLSAVLYAFAELLEIQEKSLEVQQKILEHVSDKAGMSADSTKKGTLEDIESNLPNM